MTDLILASASPRRSELLAQIGVRFETRPVDIPEIVQPGESAEAFVRRLALEKARAGVAVTEGRCPALGSDTAVVIDGRILGKPVNEDDAVAMLLALSGRRHQVLTGVALADGERSATKVVTTEVEFAILDEGQCRRYWATGEPRDKAGAYGIQGFGAVFVNRIEGSYSSVVGLPLAETARLLSRFGIPVWQQGAD